MLYGADLCIGERTPAFHRQHDRSCWRGVIADERARLGRCKMNASAFDAVDRFDCACKISLTCTAQSFALKRPAGTHGQAAQDRVATGGCLRKALPGKHHASLVDFVLANRNVSGIPVDCVRNACRLQGVSNCCLVAISKAGIDRRLVRALHCPPCGAGHQQGSAAAERRQGATDCWLICETAQHRQRVGRAGSNAQLRCGKWCCACRDDFLIRHLTPACS